ncbi:MAG TPA: PRC-barrel domain-containing protein [Chloroflexota bacterium]|nr:PRC-barrel domain-containing protein [Chloroflexota bacterium]
MEFSLGSDVRGRDGTTLGSLQGVVYDPGTGQIVSLVVRHGFEGRTAVLPIGSVASADGNGVETELDQEQLAAMPDYADDVNIAPPPTADNLEGREEIAPDNVPDVPPVGAATGVSSIAFIPIIREVTHVPEGDDVLGRRTAVYATDGEIGHVSSILVDDQTMRPTSLLISEGLLFPRTVAAPMTAVQAIEPDHVVLNVPKEHLTSPDD